MPLILKRSLFILVSLSPHRACQVASSQLIRRDISDAILLGSVWTVAVAYHTRVLVEKAESSLHVCTGVTEVIYLWKAVGYVDSVTSDASGILWDHDTSFREWKESPEVTGLFTEAGKRRIGDHIRLIKLLLNLWAAWLSVSYGLKETVAHSFKLHWLFCRYQESSRASSRRCWDDAGSNGGQGTDPDSVTV